VSGGSEAEHMTEEEFASIQYSTPEFRISVALGVRSHHSMNKYVSYVTATELTRRGRVNEAHSGRTPSGQRFSSGSPILNAGQNPLEAR
jgi:hypothetical protein